MFDSLLGLFILVGLIIVGFLIIIFIAKVLWFFLPAGIIALIVYLLTGDLTWTGIAFIGVAALSLLKKIF